MRTNGRKSRKVNKESETTYWLLDKMRNSECNVSELARLVGCSRVTLYKAMNEPAEYFTINELIIIATRLNLPYRDVHAWAVGVSSSVINRGEGRYWFE